MEFKDRYLCNYRKNINCGKDICFFEGNGSQDMECYTTLNPEFAYEINDIKILIASADEQKVLADNVGFDAMVDILDDRAKRLISSIIGKELKTK